MKRLQLARTLLLLGVLTHLGGMARAGITDFGVDKFENYTQTSNTQPAMLTSASFDSSLDASKASDVGTVTASFAGPSSPLIYTGQSGSFSYYSPDFQTQAQLDTAFPFGIPYTIQASGGTLGTLSATIDTPSMALYSPIPFLTGTTYSQLQGLNAATSDPISFNSFTRPPGANGSSIFILITSLATGDTVYVQFGLSPSTTSVVLPANTLAANTAYEIDLDYITGIDSKNAEFGGASFAVTFSSDTSAYFTTAATVPEPASLALTAIGVASALLASRKRWSRPSA